MILMERTLRAQYRWALDQHFIAMLKDLRKTVAKKHKLPPYVIFQDISLEQMATMYPVDYAGIAEYPGSGSR